MRKFPFLCSSQQGRPSSGLTLEIEAMLRLLLTFFALDLAKREQAPSVSLDEPQRASAADRRG
jgi:hypothetical protein